MKPPVQRLLQALLTWLSRSTSSWTCLASCKNVLLHVLSKSLCETVDKQAFKIFKCCGNPENDNWLVKLGSASWVVSQIVPINGWCLEDGGQCRLGLSHFCVRDTSSFLNWGSLSHLPTASESVSSWLGRICWTWQKGRFCTNKLITHQKINTDLHWLQHRSSNAHQNIQNIKASMYLSLSLSFLKFISQVRFSVACQNASVFWLLHPTTTHAPFGWSNLLQECV